MGDGMKLHTTREEQATVKESLTVPTTEESSAAQMHYDGKPVDATPVHDSYHPSDGPVALLGLELRARRAETRAFTLSNEHLCLTLKLDTAEKRITELEREVAWVRAFPLTDGHAMAIGQYELLQRIKDHLASKPTEDWKP